MESIKYLDLVQTNVKEFNDQQTLKQMEFKKKFGEQQLNKILWGKKHHELKASRTVDYSLTNQELDQLSKNGIFFKETKNKTFAGAYLDLYNNDMPVFVTSDSMLHPFHKFYDNFLKNFEETKMIQKLKLICSKLLENIYTIIPNDQNHDLLKFLELIFIVPYILVNLNNELTPLNCNLLNKLEILTKEEKESLLAYKSSYELRTKELKQGFKSINQEIYSEQFKNKLDYFKLINALPSNFNLKQICNSSPKYFTLISTFKLPNLDFSLNLKYTDKSELEYIIKSIANLSNFELDFKDVKMQFEGSQFKPRGHYTESLNLKKYFQAFSWLAKFKINLKKSIDECRNQLFLICCLTKIAEFCFNEINEFEDFISKIIGEPDGYTLISFLLHINNLIPKMNLNESITWITENMDKIIGYCQTNLTKHSKLTQMGDTDKEQTLFSFSIISKGNQLDNLIIQKNIDYQFVDDDNNVPMRKFTSVFELVYLLFDNKDVKDILHDRMNKIYQNNRDGYKYNNHLNKISKELETIEFSKTIYAQELKMLRALSKDRELMKIKNFYPFFTSNWMKKQAQTQIAHYAELRHDNVLYLDEVCGMRCECEYPDLLIEPVPNFWKEFLVLISMMETMDGKNKRLTNFSNIISKFIKYLDDLLEHKTVDPKLEEELKTIIKEEHMGSGGADYFGWYMELYHNQNEAFDCKPEISAMFASPDDDRGEGGVVHLGTGPVQIMYLVVKDYITGQNKIMLGPTYSAYEFMTPFGNRLNDDEWSKKYKQYQKIQMI